MRYPLDADMTKDLREHRQAAIAFALLFWMSSLATYLVPHGFWGTFFLTLSVFNVLMFIYSAMGVFYTPLNHKMKKLLARDDAQ